MLYGMLNRMNISFFFPLWAVDLCGLYYTKVSTSAPAKIFIIFSSLNMIPPESHLSFYNSVIFKYFIDITLNVF